MSEDWEPYFTTPGTIDWEAVHRAQARCDEIAREMKEAQMERAMKEDITTRLAETSESLSGYIEEVGDRAARAISRAADLLEEAREEIERLRAKP